MRRLLVAGIALAVSALAPVSAADVLVPVYKSAPVPRHNWAGFYLGGNAGYSWTRTGIDYRQAPGALGDFGAPFDTTGLTAPFETTPRGFIGGGQLGYNFQSGAVVFGVEADFAWRNASSSTGRTFATFGDQLTFNTEQKWVGTVRGRLGWTPANAWLVHVTGGLAYGKASNQFSQVVVAPPGFEGSRSISSDSSKLGWTLGAGTEYAFNSAWSLGFEYLYMKLGSDSLLLPVQTINTITYAATTADFNHSSHALRVKLNYHPK